MLKFNDVDRIVMAVLADSIGTYMVQMGAC